MGKGYITDPLKNAKAAIFDLDGTVLDSMGCWPVLNERFLSEHRIRVPHDHQKTVASMGFMDAARYMKRAFGLTEEPDEIHDYFMRAGEAHYRQNVALKPNVKAFLQVLKARGIKLGVATSSLRRIYMPALENHGIDSLFDAFVDAGDIARGKNFPDIYLEAARRLNTSPAQCAVFEDILAGARSAKSAGMTVVGVYDESAKADREAIEAIADCFIEDYAQIAMD